MTTTIASNIISLLGDVNKQYAHLSFEKGRAVTPSLEVIPFEGGTEKYAVISPKDRIVEAVFKYTDNSTITYTFDETTGLSSLKEGLIG
jgi:hypothetical protein